MKKKIDKKRLNVVLNGGLGNQLFIYSAAKKFAKKKKIKNIFFYPSYGILNQYKNISFYIDNIKIEQCSSNKFLNFLYVLFKLKIFNSLITDNYILNKNPNKFTLIGYFQNQNWYKSVYKDVIREIFSISFIKYLRKIKLHDVVLSLRRRDYIGLGMCLDENYYINSLKKLKIKKKEKIKIISDDSYFAKKLKKLLKKKGYSLYKENQYYKNKSLNDFLVLIKSKKLIMSNSSFCWWASVCRKKLNLKSKNVVCPKEWFPDNKNIIKNITVNHPGNPLNWKLVKSEFIV